MSRGHARRRRYRHHHGPTFDTSSGTHVDDVVRAGHQFSVVLDHEHRVSGVLKRFQRSAEPIDVLAGAIDGGLVEDVTDPDQLEPRLAESLTRHCLPHESVAVARSRVRYSRPTRSSKARRGASSAVT